MLFAGVAAEKRCVSVVPYVCSQMSDSLFEQDSFCGLCTVRVVGCVPKVCSNLPALEVGPLNVLS